LSEVGEPIDILGELAQALAVRPRDDSPERHTADQRILEAIALAASAVHREPQLAAEPVPKRVATALALALLSAPHFTGTLPPPGKDGHEVLDAPFRPADPPLLLSNEVLERALGIAGWEIDELREEVDRRAGRALKYLRTANWLWSYFQLGPQPTWTLSRVLFPGTAEPGPAITRRGGQLYLLADMTPHSPHALFLPWLSPEPALCPTSFRSRSVDPSLRSRVGRGIGADEEEVSELLEAMVALVPASDPSPWLSADQWRTHGYAAITDLGTAYSAGDWLLRPIPTDGADWRAWIRVGPEGLKLKNAPEKVFDALALPRVSAMVRLLYAALLAAVYREGRGGDAVVRPVDIDLFDVPRHMKAVLAPLHTWAGRSSTVRHVAKETGRPLDEASRLFTQLRTAWTNHEKTSWCGLPGTRTPSIQTLVLEHLLALAAGLRTGMRRAPDARAAHGTLALLFAAHYLREARLERLWVKSMSDCPDPARRIPPPEDIVGTWFFRALRRVLDEAEREEPPQRQP
jgi:hypothetical protein